MVHKLDDTFTSAEEFLKLLRSGFHSRGSRLVSLGCDLGVRMFCKSPGNADIQPSVRTTGNSQLELEANDARQPSTQGYPPSLQAPGGLCAGRPLERVSSRVRRGAQDDPPPPPALSLGDPLGVTEVVGAASLQLCSSSASPFPNLKFLRKAGGRITF